MPAILPPLTVKPTTETGRPRVAQTTPAAPLTTAGLASPAARALSKASDYSATGAAPRTTLDGAIRRPTPAMPGRAPERYSSVMSRESLRLVEAAYDALTERGVEAFAVYWADDIEWQAIGGRFRGGDAGRAYLQEWFSYFDDLTTEALEFMDLGTDRVVVWIRISGRGRSGIEPPPEYFATVVELRDGKIARAVEYPTLADALEAASASR